jgi:hypothetical protein
VKRTPLRRKSRLRARSARRGAAYAAYRRWVLEVRARDTHCQWDGCFLSVDLEGHHVYPQGHYPSLRLLLENGLTLCREHHRKWHSQPRANRRRWQERYPERARFLLSLIGKRCVPSGAPRSPGAEGTPRR